MYLTFLWIYWVCSEATFRSIEKWYFGATFTLIAKKNGVVNGNLIVETFGVDKNDANQLLKDLVKAGLLKIENKKYIRATPWYKVPDVPSFYIQRYHATHLDLAKNALSKQRHTERDISGFSFSFNSLSLCC